MLLNTHHISLVPFYVKSINKMQNDTTEYCKAFLGTALHGRGNAQMKPVSMIIFIFHTSKKDSLQSSYGGVQCHIFL